MRTHPAGLSGARLPTCRARGGRTRRDGDESRASRTRSQGRRAPGRHHRLLEWRADPSRAVALARTGARQRRPDGYAWTAPRWRDKGRFADNRRKAYHLSKSAEADPIRLALNIENKALA